MSFGGVKAYPTSLLAASKHFYEVPIACVIHRATFVLCCFAACTSLTAGKRMTQGTDVRKWIDRIFCYTKQVVNEYQEEGETGKEERRQLGENGLLISL